VPIEKTTKSCSESAWREHARLVRLSFNLANVIGYRCPKFLDKLHVLSLISKLQHCLLLKMQTVKKFPALFKQLTALTFEGVGN
jgi:hypothetical protein